VRRYQKGAIVEAQKLGIPVIGIVDTNNSPLGVDYVIPKATLTRLRLSVCTLVLSLMRSWKVVLRR